ncbi:MAG: hypothetical protein IPG45_38230 [Deltaproteobacteria bacterium]|nr:hypothetical protein [Deltaproteobacteria bacterium]
MFETSWARGWVLATFVGLGACGGELELEEELGSELELEFHTSESGLCSAVSPARELMIRHLAVVNDPVRTRWTGSLADASDGAWHFGRLMTQMAPPGANASDFVLAWLRQFATNRTINGQTVPARPAINQLISDWPKLANGKLDLTRAPLRLLAIVNRMDLRNLAQGRAGEGRFVFGVLDAAGNPQQFTVILEYNLPATTQAQLTAWANRWHDLGALGASTAAYRTALQAVTDRFARRNAQPTRPNGSAISQVRTNEIALAAPWELREFRLNANGALVEVTTALTPRDALNGSAVLRDFINQNANAIVNNRHGVPLSIGATPFRAAASQNNIDFWNAPGISNANARHVFSLNTCDGCHGAETATGFLQIQPRVANQVSALAGFLTGITVADPVTGTNRTFNDLGRRATDLRSLVCPTVAPATLGSEADLEAPLGTRVH